MLYVTWSFYFKTTLSKLKVMMESLGTVDILFKDLVGRVAP